MRRKGIIIEIVKNLHLSMILHMMMMVKEICLMIVLRAQRNLIQELLPCHLVELRLGLREFLHNKNVLEIQGQRKALPKLKKSLATLKDTLRLSKKLMALLTWPMEVMPLHGLKRTTRWAMKLMDPSSWRSITTRPMDVMPFRGLMGRTRWEMKGDKYNENEPDALDLFKECHYSKKKKGYTFAVHLAIIGRQLNYFSMKFLFNVCLLILNCLHARLKWKTSGLRQQKVKDLSL